MHQIDLIENANLAVLFVLDNLRSIFFYQIFLMATNLWGTERPASVYTRFEELCGHLLFVKDQCRFDFTKFYSMSSLHKIR